VSVRVISTYPAVMGQAPDGRHLTPSEVMFSNEHISRKKKSFPVSRNFARYLARHGRTISLPVSYEMLRDYQDSISLYDKDGKDTLWETVFYPPSMSDEINRGLKRTYSILKASGYTEAEEHLHIERIDYCVFGNSKPFRIKIVNNYNEVHDYFYFKIADTSRIWGLELEHLLSPYRINYLVDGQTLIEEHIPGVPGDVFALHHMQRKEFNPRRIAKEFVKFNERCFMRLLGDMRSYNFVFDITQDFDDIQFRIRAMDFDQQAYEGRKNIYLPQFFKENRVFVDEVLTRLHPDVIMQYQMEERSLFTRRVKAEYHRLSDLQRTLNTEELALPEKIRSLKEELAAHHMQDNFMKCNTMPQILHLHIKAVVRKDLRKA
jgi:hypothetical protein